MKHMPLPEKPRETLRSPYVPPHKGRERPSKKKKYKKKKKSWGKQLFDGIEEIIDIFD
ncbi:hypothetical protein N6L24_11120 [Cognatishimia sp. SS12]|uniref:hypothetical protein n=1 Tax=Cognatishimia sp. SS12 TaxID=2979465 RepID=UPI00232FB2EB|nr:hypothetical protein [Cognatishimia sp. SS12]MDC0738831.1 hypothetical protein [Cognatishimia sp. SS12]